MIVWSVPADAMEDVGDLDRVGHDGDARHVRQPLGEGVGRRPGRDRDRHPGLGEADGRVGDRVLLGLLERRLDREAGLEHGRPRDRRRAAVDLLEQAALVEDLEVAPDGHVGHAELAHEVRDAHGAVLAHAVEDECLTLAREHQGTLFIPVRSVEMDTRPHPF